MEFISAQTIRFSGIVHRQLPFRWWVIDNFIEDKSLLENVYNDFKRVCVTRPDWWRYNNPFERKLAFDKIQELPRFLKLYFNHLNSPEFIDFLIGLTGVKALNPDPDYRGGGLHRIQPDGYLHIHEDFNIHPVMKQRRKLNFLLYLNPVWKREWKGNLEFWNKDMSACAYQILPIMNRAVIFETVDKAYHGHPDPTDTEVERWSLATYYYSFEGVREKPHSTLYQKREVDPPLTELRAKRALGRLTQE